MLSSDLDAAEDKDRAVLDRLLSVMISELGMDPAAKDESAVTAAWTERSRHSEMRLVVLRLFSVLMSRSKSWLGSKSAAAAAASSNFVATASANALLKAGCLEHCLQVRAYP